MKTNTFRTISKYLLPVGVIAMLFSLTACNLPFKVVWNDQQAEHVEMEAPENEGEPYPEENFGEGQPEGGFIEFQADRTQLAPGECTMIWWHAEGVEDVSINGDPVEPMGEQEICLQQNERFVLEAGGERREIEFTVDGMPGEEQSPEEPNHEEEPPPGGHMNDEDAIKQALLAELGANEGEMEITFGRMDEHFAEGGVIESNAAAGGGQWLAAKDNGRWVIVHHGQDLPPCDAVNAYNFPSDWVPQCWDAASGNAVNR